MKAAGKNSFEHGFNLWSNAIAKKTNVNWTEQLAILNEVEDLITADLSLEEIIAAIYLNLNQLLDAYQFCVGIYNETEGSITYRGMIEDGKRLPDFSMSAYDPGRLASWCIRNEKEIFMNDFDHEFQHYLQHKPMPLKGAIPQAAIYVPLKLHNKMVGLIVVRTIRKNVYLQHHLYILKTVGNFVVRTLELAKISSRLYEQTGGKQKKWKWCDKENMTDASWKLLSALTDREREVLLLMVTGLPNKEIARQLFVSPGTIKTHTLHIYNKMVTANRTSAISKALELGWIA